MGVEETASTTGSSIVWHTKLGQDASFDKDCMKNVSPGVAFISRNKDEMSREHT